MNIIPDDEKDEIRAFIASGSPTQAEIERHYTGRPDHIRIALFFLKTRQATEAKVAAKADHLVWRQIFKHDDDFTTFTDITPVNGSYSHCFKVNAAPAEQIMFIKILRKTERSDNAMQVAKVLKEYRNYNLLRDDNIVSVYNAGWVRTENGDEFPFIATEFLDGVDLSQWREKKGDTCSWKEVAEIVNSIAATLQRILNVDKKKVEKILGASGISEVMHLDLKPNNVMVVLTNDDTTKEPKEIIKLIDFASGGTAEFATAHANDQYKAPERFLPRDIRPNPDRSWDIFSLGCLIIFLLTGEHPKSSNRSRKEWEAYLSQLHFPNEDLKRICQKCLAYEAADRYACPGDVSKDLTALLSFKPLPIARNDNYKIWETEFLLFTRGQLRNDVDDHLQIIARGSWALIPAPILLACRFYYLICTGMEPGMAFHEANYPAIAYSFVVFAALLFSVRMRLRSLKVVAPLAAMLSGFLILMIFLNPEKWFTFYPSYADACHGAPIAMLIYSIVLISISSVSERLNSVTAFGILLLVSTIFLRPFFESPNGAIWMPFVNSSIEVVGCYLFGRMLNGIPTSKMEPVVSS